jgi:hypothetical protein
VPHQALPNANAATRALAGAAQGANCLSFAAVRAQFESSWNTARWLSFVQEPQHATDVAFCYFHRARYSLFDWPRVRLAQASKLSLLYLTKPRRGRRQCSGYAALLGLRPRGNANESAYGDRSAACVW